MANLYLKFAKIKSVNLSAFGFGAGVQADASPVELGFLSEFRKQLNLLKKKNIGVLFIIDEIANTAELKTFLSAYQLLLREEHKIGLLMAGLPSNVLEILNDKVLTFLRRIHRFELHPLSTELIQLTYTEVFKAQQSLEQFHQIIQEAAQQTQGYPFLFQLIGYYLWKELPDFSQETLNKALRFAKIDMDEMVHSLMYKELSQGDKNYVNAMAQLNQPTKTGDIAKKMHKSPNYASMYRNRLIELEYIKETGYGYVDFNIPYTKDYILKTLRNSQ